MSLNPSASEFRPVPATSSGSSIAEQDQVEMLVRIFPELDRERLLETFQAAAGDLLAAVEILLSAVEEDRKKREEEEQKEAFDPIKDQETKKLVCKYFLQGQCLIKNCSFLHTRSDRSAICKYWLRGYCSRGQECAFVHSLDEIECSQEIPIEKPTSFAPRPLMAQKPKVIVPTKWNFAAKIKLKELSDEFSHVHLKIVSDLFFQNKFDMSQTKHILTQKYGGPLKSIASDSNLEDVQQNLLRRQLPPISKQDRSSAKTSPMQWLETGDSVDSLYKEQRDTAEEHCRLRNMYFMRATEAFLSGNGKLARDLSRLGREHDVKSKQAHSFAAKQIFSARNAESLETIIDVHGLHPDEAVEVIHHQLHNLRERFPAGETVDIVTGTGHHSFDGRAKLMPAIASYLSKSGLKYQKINIGGHGGLFRIKLG